MVGGKLLHWTEMVLLSLFVGGVAFFIDAPIRTFGEKYGPHHWKPRAALLIFEANLLVIWALARWGIGDISIVPAAAAPTFAIFGLLLAIVGVALAVWAKVRLGRWFTVTFAIKEGHELVTDGPYSITRHPIYTGAVMALLGAAFVWNSVLTFGLALVFGVLFFFHTVYEESLFEHHFGEPYFEYERRVPRLIPFARRKRS